MALNDLVRSVVNTADRITRSLQASVTYQPWIGQSGRGVPQYGQALSLPALIERKQGLRRSATGESKPFRATITLLRPIAANGAANREEPIDPRDKFTLPDGLTGPIVDIAGFVDPSIDAPYYHEVYLG